MASLSNSGLQPGGFLGGSQHAGSGIGMNNSLANILNLSRGGAGGGLFDTIGKFGDFLGSKSGQGLMSLGTGLANLYGMNKSLGFAEDQIDILKDQENRASTAQQFATDNAQSLALQMTTPGTPERAMVEKAISEGTFNVAPSALT